MNGHLRIKSPWSQLGIFLGLTGVTFALISVVQLLILLQHGISMQQMQNLDLSNPALAGITRLLQALSAALFIIPAAGFALIVFYDQRLPRLGFRAPDNSKMYGLAILCIVAAIPFVLWLGDLNQRLPLPQSLVDAERKTDKLMEGFLKADNNLDVFMNVLLIAALPALCEEMFFRGVLQRILINLFKNPWVGIVLTGLIFSAVHVQFLGFIPRAVLGIVLGVLFWYSGSLWTNVLAHFFNNAIQVVFVSYFPQYMNTNPSLPAIVVIASCLISLALLWVYKSLSTITYDKVYPRHEMTSHTDFLYNSSPWR